MTFAGKVWKLLVGVKDALVLLFMLLFFGGLWALMSAHPKVGSGQRGALFLQLDGPVVEQPAQPTAAQVFGGGNAPRQYRLRDVVQALRAAAKDGRVPAVVLNLDIFAGGGQTALAEVGAALDEVRKAGKPVLAYASAYDDDSYQLAAHASEVWLNPLGGVAITGPGGTELFYKGLMDKLGITANVYRVGTYKAAVEPFIRNDMSPEAKQALQGVYGAMWENWQQDVKKARPKADVAGYVADPNGRIAAAGGDLAQAALKSGLVDHLGDWTAFGKRVAQIAGVRDDDVPGSFRKIDYGPWAAANPVDDDGAQIGIVTVAGDIVDGNAGPGTAGAETIVRALDKALANRDLKALVLRVDSPGGSVLASERIRQAVLAAKAKGLPVVVSMGNLAASGGYWVSTAGDKIYAEPSTITGSIGVFAILPSFQGTLAKLGIGADGVKTTPLSGEPDLLRGPSPEVGKFIQTGIDSTYRRFLVLVGAARHMSPEQVDKIAQGHIWDGGTAHQLGLVDAFGTLDDAIHEAARRAKLDPATAKAVWLEKKPGFADRLVASFARGDRDDDAQGGGDAFARIAGRPKLLLARAMAEADRLLAGPTIQARCLECPVDGSTARQAPPPSSGFTLWLLKLVG
ncbi:MAG TPA: signal peptide peptidase SppA [Allosphingosinicella sp.]|jgi:protease-4|nr:signal peptide peptidase SppA [Allosphingosinicella sp.]